MCAQAVTAFFLGTGEEADGCTGGEVGLNPHIYRYPNNISHFAFTGRSNWGMQHRPVMPAFAGRHDRTGQYYLTPTVSALSALLQSTLVAITAKFE
jgi:hypothetical protein